MRSVGVGELHAVPVDKKIASHWGGTRNARSSTVPDGFKALGEIRTQFSHVIDIAPTILEAAGIPDPLRERRPQAPIRGHEHGLQLRRGRAPERHDLQYFEWPETVWHLPQGLSAVTRHSTPWLPNEACRPSMTTSGNSTTATPTGRRRTTSRHRIPRGFAARRLWLIEAVKYNVLLGHDDGSTGECHHRPRTTSADHGVPSQTVSPG